VRLSYVIVSWNRREQLLETLSLLPHATPLPERAWEIIVVDNASTDGSADAVADAFPRVRLVRRPTNEGVSARNHGFAIARGRYVIIIDDDSYPTGDAALRSIAYLDAHPEVGAVSGRIVLPSGRREAAALPTVMLGGATCLRMQTLREVGGFCVDFFRQAEEWDLSFRFWRAGWRVERFEDLVYRHEKVPTNRSSALRMKMDMRNNLVLLHRFLEPRLRAAIEEDWRFRYGAMARHQGLEEAAAEGVQEAEGRRAAEAEAGPGRYLSAEALEHVFGFRAQAEAVEAWARREGVRRVALVDLGKNVLATLRACRRAGLEVVALGDDHPAFRGGLTYRGLPILPLAEAARRSEAAVVSNVNPAQAPEREEEAAAAFGGPVLGLFEARWLSTGTGGNEASHRLLDRTLAH
jgi:GT2 family glycosyltransferase